MPKGVYVTGNLHRISGQIAEAASKRGGPEGQGVEAAQDSAGAPAQAPAPVQERSPEFEAALHKRHEEYLRLRRDVMARLASHLSSLPAEAEGLGRRLEELSTATAKLQELLEGLEAMGELQAGGAAYSANLSESFRSVENARLEMIRVTAKIDKGAASAAQGHGRHGGSLRESIMPELSSLDFMQLLKFGLFLTLPIAAAIIFGGFIIAISIYAAMRLGG